MLLIALVEDRGARPFSKEFQMKHGIGPSSSIKASLVSLLKKVILTKTSKNRYRFVDTFMPHRIKAIRG